MEKVKDSRKLEEDLYTPTVINDILSKEITSICTLHKRNSIFTGQFRVKGILGHIPRYNNTGRYIFNVPLSDARGGTIGLAIPTVETDRYRLLENQEVIITCMLVPNVYKGKLEFNFYCNDIQPAGKVDEELLNQDKLLRELLKNHKRQFAEFPEKETYKIKVICPRSGIAYGDFTRQISNIEGVDCSSVMVNIHSKNEIIHAIENTESDILVVTRGGGDEGDFSVFNENEVISAWTRKTDTYKISALGHSTDSTIFDVFSNYSAATPTEAGVYVKRKIEEVKLKEKVKTLHEQFSKQIEQEKKRYEQEINRLQKHYKWLITVMTGLIILLLIMLITK